ncbi:MAG: hypothetical protein ACRDYF_07705, partial [Acidimicrobiia bacterium]
MLHPDPLEQKAISPVNTTSSPPPNGPAAYTAVIARHKITIAALGVIGLALALLHGTVLADRSYESHAKVLVRPVTDAVSPQGIDRMVAMGTEREIATSAAVAAIIKERLQSGEPLAAVQK